MEVFMDLFQAIEKRRSVRKFKEQKFPDEHVHRALQAAVLAPNSSNTQTWDFYWIQTPETKSKMVEELAILENHYFSHNAWLKPNQLLQDASRLKMPITIVQGRYDMVCPFRAAWELKQRVPHARLIVVEDAGHAGSEPGIAKALKSVADLI
jgi:proline iminopeptidase